MCVCFLLVTSFCLSFRNLGYASVIQELRENGVVKYGSMLYYNPGNATLTFKLNLRVPVKLMGKKIQFRLELEEISSQEIEISKCRVRRKFDSSTRYKMTASSFEAERFTNVTFDHVYSGNYTLEVQCCVDSSCDSCPYIKYDKISVETKLNRINVDCMNISIRAVESDRGIDVDFSVNYFTDPPFLEFKEYDVIIDQQSKKLRSQTTNSTNVHFTLNFTEMIQDKSCIESENNSFPSPKNKLILCSDFAQNFIFNVTVHPRDSRCNNPLQVYLSTKLPCKRYIKKELKILTQRASLEKIIVNSPLSFVWIPLLAITISISIAIFIYLKRNRLCSRNYQLSMNSDKISTLDRNRSIRDCKILLVYDMNDDAVKNKATLLRNQMMAYGVVTIYDYCDPQQEENVNTVGPVHWFNAHLNSSDISIVVIQSSGLIQCFDELMKGDRVSDIDYVQENDLLLFVLHQLISITSISSENKYDRIFVTTYFDFERETHNYLTPFRCYVLPEHFSHLLAQIKST